MVICKTIGLNKIYYSNSKEINSIIDCNLEINSGECVAICGAKEAGKTTLLRILGGLERPSSGMIYINHNEISSYSDDEMTIMRRQEIGYLYQNDSLISELNVHENIIMPAILAHIKYDEKYYRNLIRALEINEILHLYPKQLTVYQMQCVLYARALINNPNIILIDEPTSVVYQHIDKKILDYLFYLVYQLRKTLIMVSNEIEGNTFFDHVICLDKGEIKVNKRKA